MLQTGIVREIKQNRFAEVEIVRSSACGENCASCGLCAGREARVCAVNDVNAAEGDAVLIDMADKKVISAAFLVYIVPIIALIAGYLAGDALFGGETAGIITGLVLMAAVFALIIITDRKRTEKYTPRIVKIEVRSNDGV